MRDFFKIFCACVGSFAALNGWFSFKYMMSAVYLQPVSVYLEQVGETSNNGIDTSIDLIEHYLDMAMSYDENASLLEKKGELQIAKAFDLRKKNKDEHFSDTVKLENTKEYLEAALHYFDKSLQQRPMWARTYVLYAYTKALLDEFDEKFYTAFERARQYGRDSFQVQSGLTQLGLVFWDKLTLEDQLKTKESFIKAYRLAPGKTIAFASDTQKAYMACLWVIEEKVHAAECKAFLGLNKKRV
ncbi:MAG: hypothetical protein KDI30_06195 [Pseudomonadales bacterium]|nr:hypothetical protein [Pseudomonadales bacterium]